MASSRVSIVTPSYNQATYLQDNLDSIRNQTYDNVEHLVLDGGSDDGTVDLLREYEDKYDLNWQSEPDDGQSAAINEGFEKATGDIVGWLNSDDVYIDTGVIERVVNHFEQTEADVIYGDLMYVNGESQLVEVDVRPNFDPAKLAYRVLIGQPATFFRGQVVKEHRLNTELDFCMDWEYWIRLSQHYDIQHVEDVLAGFREHEEQKTEDEIAVADEVERMLSRHRDDLPASERSVVFDNAAMETSRILASAKRTIEIHRNQPNLAFNSEMTPLREMLLNAGPGIHDVTKAIRRWRQ